MHVEYKQAAYYPSISSNLIKRGTVFSGRIGKPSENVGLYLASSFGVVSLDIPDFEWSHPIVVFDYRTHKVRLVVED
jgi:hypothetical protein